jgi:hypothetical protein
VNYLFSSLAGVSKVGGYTGTGAAQTINCGFTAGSRFVLVKAASTTSDWFVYDTARGFTSSGPNPYLVLNTTAAQVASTTYLANANSGFQLTGTAFNNTGETYIFLAIA